MRDVMDVTVIVVSSEHHIESHLRCNKRIVVASGNAELNTRDDAKAIIEVVFNGGGHAIDRA